MQIYSPTLKGPLKISGFIDPDDVTKISVFWGAPVFSPSTVYRSMDICRPTTDNGYYYQCSTNGVSAATEPSWNQEESTSGSCVFSAIPWNLWLFPGESIDNSEWSVNTLDVTLNNDSFNEYQSVVFVSNVSANITEFVLTNQITKSNGEKLSRSFLYKINQQ